MGVRVRQANTGDLESVVALAERVQLPESEESPPDSFLVSAYHRDRYAEILNETPHFFVAEIEGAFAGFAFGFESASIPDANSQELNLKAEFPEPFFVIKQVCASPDFRRQGVASELYGALLEAAGTQPVIASVVTDPPNLPSEAFHQSNGFSEVMAYRGPDGRMRKVFQRLPN